ncbi:transposase, partial [Candidatus Woesearchaeota archaeon]|nr:transposase [Candidatus Woesearchaeota archaeon]
MLEELHEFGIEISTGQISDILTAGHESFHAEKAEILSTGLEISPYINVDDTGARHNGTNGYCTHIGNELFAWFESTESKSRINFLELLCAGHVDYVINVDALLYMQEHKLPQTELKILESGLNLSPNALIGDQTFTDKVCWQKYLLEAGVCQERHVRIATEGALMGSLMAHGFSRELAILSDDAGQFAIFLHALCWVHAERAINKLVPASYAQRLELESKRKQIWDLYARLKDYKRQPEEKLAVALETQFEEIFNTPTAYSTLNHALARLYKNKNELLLVLKRPEIPLHNNA